MKTAVIYVRVSSQEQVEGFSIDAQIKACKEKAIDTGHKVVKVFRDEGYSGRSKDRPALQEMLKYTKNKEVTSVVIHKLDRFARSVVDHSALRALLMRNGTALLSCTEQLGDAPHEIFLENIMASMAQFYSDNLKTETRKGLVQRFESGYHLTAPPYGYRVLPGSKVMQIDKEEAKVVQTIFDLYNTGRYSYKRLAQLIAKEYGYKTRGGKPFGKTVIGRMLTNSAYIGIVEYKRIGRKTKGLHKPIISKDIFETAQTIAYMRNGGSKREKNVHNFLYKGVVRCEHCGKNLQAGYSTGKSGNKHLYYFCRCDNPKDVKNIKGKYMNKAFEDLIETLEFSSAVIPVVDQYVEKHLKRYEDEMRNEADQREKDYQSIKKEKKDIYFDFKKGLIDEETYKDLDSELDDKKLIYKVAMNESQIDYQDLLTQLRTFANFGYKVKKYWDIATPAQKSHMLSSMVLCTPSYSKGRLLNPKISPLYQAFRDFPEGKSTSGVADGT